MKLRGDFLKNIIKLKNVFCILTVIWSIIMLVEYIAVLLPYTLKGFIFDIFDFLVIFLYLGIWCVPVLFVISITLILRVKKHKVNNNYKFLNTITVMLPIILAILMLMTDFNSRLQ